MWSKTQFSAKEVSELCAQVLGQNTRSSMYDDQLRTLKFYADHPEYLTDTEVSSDTLAAFDNEVDWIENGLSNSGA